MHERLRKEKAIINVYLHILDLSHRFLSHVASPIKYEHEIRQKEIKDFYLIPLSCKPSRRETFPF